MGRLTRPARQPAGPTVAEATATNTPQPTTPTATNNTDDDPQTGMIMMSDTAFDDAGQATAMFQLAFAQRTHQDLARAEVQSRLRLTAALLELDEAIDYGPAIDEQLSVELALRAYGRALADLLRGTTDSPIHENRE